MTALLIAVPAAALLTLLLGLARTAKHGDQQLASLLDHDCETEGCYSMGRTTTAGQKPGERNASFQEPRTPTRRVRPATPDYEYGHRIKAAADRTRPGRAA